MVAHALPRSVSLPKNHFVTNFDEVLFGRVNAVGTPATERI
jgi:hypothetical protein